MEIGRKPLNHELPEGASDNPELEVFFITIACEPRGRNHLAHDEIWRVMEETMDRREALGQMHVRMALAMPDHLHGLFSFPAGRMSKHVASMKQWVAKKTQVRWQREFFDHRIRTWESMAEKVDYIRQNPVRAGLVTRSEDWPYQR